MKEHLISFKTAVDSVEIPKRLNNPFDTFVPEICKVAAQELQRYIAANEANWAHDFGFYSSTKGSDKDKLPDRVKGKMFGVLVVRTEKGSLGYLAAFSGNLLTGDSRHPFVSSVFDATVDDYFINRGMSALTALSDKINELKKTQDSAAKENISKLKLERKNKSYQLQQQLFENYRFTSVLGSTANLIHIFSNIPNARPAAGTGECAAPKLLQYALENKLEPIAITEFWWGRSPKTIRREHKAFYPACQNKCRHLLEYMLHDSTLYDAGK